MLPRFEPRGSGPSGSLGVAAFAFEGGSLFDFAWSQKPVTIVSLIWWVGEGGVGWVVGWVSGSWLWLASPFGFGRRVPA